MIGKFSANLPFVSIVGLLLHDLEYPLAGISAVFGVSINGDGLLKRANIVLAVHVDARAALLRDEPDGAALAADDGADHVALHEQAQREVRGREPPPLAPPPPRPPPGRPRRPLAHSALRLLLSCDYPPAHSHLSH